MRNPIRSESDAFYITMGSSALIIAAILLGAIVDPLVGVALLVGAVIGALVWEVATKDPQRRRPLREAASRPAARSPRRIHVCSSSRTAPCRATSCAPSCAGAPPTAPSSMSSRRS